MLIPMIKQYKVLEFQSSWEIFTPAMLDHSDAWLVNFRRLSSIPDVHFHP